MKSVGADGVDTEIIFATEVKGSGRFPSGRNLGSGHFLQPANDGTVTGTWQGVFTTTDGEQVTWKSYSRINQQQAGRVEV